MLLIALLTVVMGLNLSVLELEIICPKSGGEVFIAIYDSKDSFMETEIVGERVKVLDGRAKLTLQLKPGLYAISIFQDLNDNAELDANFMGIPNEPYGFSNNARGRFGPPTYEDCEFNSAEVNTMTIKLQ